MMFVLKDRNTALLVLDDGIKVAVPIAGLRVVVQTADMMAEQEDADEGWLTVSEAARVLRASESSVRHWCQHGQLRASKRGRRWVVRPSAIDAFMGAGQ